MKTTDKVALGALVILMVGINAVLITAFTTPSSSDAITLSEYDETRHVTSTEAKTIALTAAPGTITDFELDTENGVLVYEVTITENNVETEVTIDRATGTVLSVHAEDDETDSDEETDVPITGNALEQASQAALDHIGEGYVSDSEIGDEDGYYEIEITLDNGGEVDVHLDEHFNVLSVEYD